MLAGHSFNKIVEMIKIGIVGAELPGQLPYPLYRVQVGAVRREELQGQGTHMFFEERLKDDGVMVFGIVEDDHHLFPLWATSQHESKEAHESEGVESLLFTLGYQGPLPYVDRSEQRDGFPRRRHEERGVFIFRRNPHGDPRSVLLEMAFVEAPQINVVSSCQDEAFF